MKASCPQFPHFRQLLHSHNAEATAATQSTPHLHPGLRGVAWRPAPVLHLRRSPESVTLTLRLSLSIPNAFLLLRSNVTCLTSLNVSATIRGLTSIFLLARAMNSHTVPAFSRLTFHQRLAHHSHREQH